VLPREDRSRTFCVKGGRLWEEEKEKRRERETKITILRSDAAGFEMGNVTYVGLQTSCHRVFRTGLYQSFQDGKSFGKKKEDHLDGFNSILLNE
jgi:hypothetical protein